MPLATRVQIVPLADGQRGVLKHPCVLLRENDTWSVIDPENNNPIIKGASTAFIRREIAQGRLTVDKGWDK